MTKAIVRATPEKDYFIILEYQGGEARRFDMKPWLDKGVFTKLKDYNIFNALRVSFDTVEWPGNIDMDPETLYEDSIAVYPDFRAGACDVAES